MWLFLDLSKVLDTVNHSRLLLKLKSIGFSSHVCEWFKSYLTHRCQVTVVDNKQSSGKPMNIGVPQGSILRPLLFIIYVNELPNCITSCDILICMRTILSSIFLQSLSRILRENLTRFWQMFRAVARALIGGGGGGCLFIYSCYARRISFEISRA